MDMSLQITKHISSVELNPGSLLTKNRPQRQHTQPSHTRVPSLASTISDFTAMSFDSSGYPYTDAGNPDINECLLEYTRVPWGNPGPGSLTVNLGLFFIHLLAAGDISVKERYPEIGAWQKVINTSGQIQYRQVGSNEMVSQIPRGATLDDSPATTPHNFTATASGSSKFPSRTTAGPS